jgi:hypothetical protein
MAIEVLRKRVGKLKQKEKQEKLNNQLNVLKTNKAPVINNRLIMWAIKNVKPGSPQNKKKSSFYPGLSGPQSPVK